MNNRVNTFCVFDTLNDNAKEVSVMDATKIYIGLDVFAVIGYHCGQLLGVKICDIPDDNGHVGLYLLKNSYGYVANKKMVNSFKAELVGYTKIKKVNKDNKINKVNKVNKINKTEVK